VSSVAHRHNLRYPGLSNKRNKHSRKEQKEQGQERKLSSVVTKERKETPAPRPVGQDGFARVPAGIEEKHYKSWAKELTLWHLPVLAWAVACSHQRGYLSAVVLWGFVVSAQEGSDRDDGCGLVDVHHRETVAEDRVGVGAGDVSPSGLRKGRRSRRC
jgi:hypothetical protein